MTNSCQYRIYYEDTDAGGIVYYANYLKFFERARTEFLRDRKISQSNLAKNLGIIFVVRNCQIDFKSSAKLDDLVNIKTSLSSIRAASIKMHQEMFCDQELLNILDCEIVCVDSSTMKPKKIPEALIHQITS